MNVMNISSNHWKWNFSEQLPGYITTKHKLGGGTGECGGRFSQNATTQKSINNTTHTI